MTAAAGAEALKLGFYFGEHDRHRGRFLSETALDLFARHRLAAGVLLRGAEGFGAAQLLQTDRLLSLSEDLPLVALAVGDPAAVEACAGELREAADGGLLTLERARLHGPVRRTAHEPHEEVKLTVYCGRGARRDGAPEHVGVVAALHRRGVAGATALVGVDGAASGRRLRARFFARNERVPALVVAVGERERIAAALADLERGGQRPTATLEAVRVLRRDGAALAAPADRSGVRGTRLTVYCSERSEHRGRPLYLELIRRLRAEGAAGATALRGVWGYHGDHAPHGDRLLSLRRHVPIVVTVIDDAARAGRWLDIAAELTDETGLLTVERVPRMVTLE
ncbi:MAG: DUF190 domain-containing protein [Syntrophothermus sp.]